MTQHCLDTPPRAEAAAAPPDAGSPPVHRVHHARADCTADSAGGLTFRVRLFDETAKEIKAPEVPEAAAVLLRLRRHHGPDASLRLPLVRTAADGGLRAVLAGTALLREGRWDASLVLADEEPQRLLPGVHDLRTLASHVPRETHAWLGVRIPYTTKHGNLTLRTWLRRPHAEAGALHLGDGAMALRGRLYGAPLTATACLEAHPRDSEVSPVRVPVRLDDEDERSGHGAAPGHGSAPGYGADARYPARGFAAELPLSSLLPGHRMWDLWLRPSVDEEPVRLARILDDILDKKRIFSYPPQRVTSSDGAVHSARPYYTVNNNLSVHVSDEDGGPAQAGR
ncbi:hypothetical protein [Streptomyces iconiensis]|uniref:Transferase n=1 Tax=Streptomyces iconiensis TaxID=1384038 RepID=A0ABT6ZSL1_9ACTN|nr:hypothetical protein [Streptomyces iconiensis]MDJ1132047.1 hypothetical protein [Streptomyces iconiensis]